MTSAQQKLRLEQLKKLAAEGLTHQQIATRLGMRGESLRKLAARNGIELAKEES